MTPFQFSDAIKARWPTKSQELLSDLVKFAGFYNEEDLDLIVEALVQNYDGDYMPRLPKIRAICEANKIAQRSHNTATGYSVEFGGFLAFYCKVCTVHFQTSQEGPFCPVCRSRRTQTTVLKVCKAKPDFVQEMRRATEYYEANNHES
jgi:hypothetical protein